MSSDSTLAGICLLRLCCRKKSSSPLKQQGSYDIELEVPHPGSFEEDHPPGRY